MVGKKVASLLKCLGQILSSWYSIDMFLNVTKMLPYRGIKNPGFTQNSESGEVTMPWR